MVEKQHVKAMDLSAFIGQFQLASLFLKLDVEGAEYPIMKKLVRQGQLCRPNVIAFLAIEFHPWIESDGMQGFEPEFVRLFRCCGVRVHRFFR